MFCYRDRAFCSAFPERCSNDTCGSAFTAAESARAAKWWKRRSSLLASKRELSIQLRAPLDLEPSEFSYGWEDRQ